MYYVPDIINAYNSVEYLQTQVAFGQIVRGMHHWGASLVIVMMFLHTMRVFFTGSYKAPREMNWVVGMLIFFVMLGLGLTGYLLPWDNKAYFATKVTLRLRTPYLGLDLSLKNCARRYDRRRRNVDAFLRDSRILPSGCPSCSIGRTLYHDPQTRYFRSTIRRRGGAYLWHMVINLMRK